MTLNNPSSVLQLALRKLTHDLSVSKSNIACSIFRGCDFERFKVVEMTLRVTQSLVMAPY